MRALATSVLTLALCGSLTACSLLENEPEIGPETPAPPVQFRVLATPLSPFGYAKPGDTLLIYIDAYPSLPERYRAVWSLNGQGERIDAGCTRGACTRWVAPSASGLYLHSVSVTGKSGYSDLSFVIAVR